MENSKHEDLLRQVVNASNRTTRAVRAIVRFFFIQLAATTAASFLVLAGIMVNPLEPNSALIIFGVLIWIVGVVWSSQAGWTELQLSEIPRDEFRPISSLASQSSGKRGSTTSPGKTTGAISEEMLSESQKSDWIMAGKPDLSSWDGKQPFQAWLYGA